MVAVLLCEIVAVLFSLPANECRQTRWQENWHLIWRT